jgi:hypothetical protein
MTVLLVLVAYAGLAGVLPAAGRPWIALPLCLIALVAVGELALRAVAGSRPEDGARLPAARIGFAGIAGLVTLPLVALALHAAGAPVRPAPLVAGGVVAATLLGAGVHVRERFTRSDPDQPVGTAGLPAQRGPDRSPRPGLAGTARTAAAVIVPVLLAIVAGGFAVRAYLTAPRPAQPGYLSVALAGWATTIEHPVAVPARGLTVPVRVTSSGLATVTTVLRLRVGGQVLRSVPVTVAANTAQQTSVRIPALPPDGCLRAVSISVGRMSTGFYARAAAGVPGRAAC